MNKKIHQKLCSILFLFLAVISFQNIINAQEVVENHTDENWVLEYGLHYEPQINFRYENYSKADTVKFREKYKLIESLNSLKEWEGTYSVGVGELSLPIFRWSSNDGFIEYYINTCYPSLESINYGTVINAPEYIQLLPEKTNDSPRKIVSSRFVKVKWGKNFYLVEESSLQAFAEKAVGIYVEPEESSDENYQKWGNFMVNGDEENLSENLPEFPPSYKKIQRSPIKAKILTVGKRTIEAEKELGNAYYSEAAWYSVTIDAGENQNVKVGMRFDISESRDEIFITKINPNSSVGLIHRVIDENKIDLCHDKNHEQISCLQIKPTFEVKTQIGKFLLF